MRLWKSAFDCSRSRSFSAARSGSFQTIGVVDQKAVLCFLRPASARRRGKTRVILHAQLDAAGIQLHQLAPRRNIPEADRLVTAARRQGATIRRKRHGIDRTGMPLERFQKFSGGDVPQLHGPPTTGQGQGLAVRRKGHILDHAPSSLAERHALIGILERLRRFPGLGRPDDRRPVAAAAGQQLSIPARSREKHSSPCVHSGGGSVGAWRPPRPSADWENSDDDITATLSRNRRPDISRRAKTPAHRPPRYLRPP